ncbi:MAG: glycosyltransferase [Anaerostipes sp.]|nr:glycosyltransferase [Anaerostipes sp.]
MKKICFVANELLGGGAERVMTVIANDLVSRGIKVSFMLLKSSQCVYTLDSRIKVNVLKGDSKKKNPIEQIRYIRKNIKKEKNTVYVSFLTYTNLYLIMASIGLGVRVIVSERNDPRYSIPGNFKKIVRYFLYFSPWCKKIIFQTPGAMKYYPESIQKKGIIIVNPIKQDLPERFEGMRSNRIVSFGRFEEQKNYTMLINAFSKFVSNNPEYILELYGKGTKEEALREEAKRLGLSKKIVFNDFSENVHELVLDAKMFILPSNYEGLSNSMLEAMAIGLPTICTDCPSGGAKMVILNKVNGILIPVKDTLKLTNAMETIVGNLELEKKLSCNAYKIREEFSQTKICSIWETELFN